MARIQRKKKVKKKKQPSAEGMVSQGPNSNAVAKKAETGSVKNIKAKTYSPIQKSLTRTKDEPGKIKGGIDKGLQFLREVKVELKKVVWPTRKQTIGSTVVVLILTIIIAIFLGMVDMGLSGLVRMVLK